MNSLCLRLAGTTALVAILSFSPIVMTAHGPDIRAAFADGAAGATGATGSAGADGTAGATGSVGAAGTIDGSTGPTGATGVPGTANVQTADVAAAVSGTGPASSE